jgi:hypothetical protein
MKRFKIVKLWSAYHIFDRFKLKTCLADKRLTKTAFPSVEYAQGFLFGLSKKY